MAEQIRISNIVFGLAGKSIGYSLTSIGCSPPSAAHLCQPQESVGLLILLAGN